MMDMTPLCREFWEKGRSDGCPVYEMHGHMGPYAGIYFPNHAPDRMVRRMEMAGVRLTVFSHHAALGSPDIGNRESVEAVRAYPDRLKAYCVINPNYPRQVEAELENYRHDSDVYVGFKLHPSAHKTPLTDDSYAPALAFADCEGLLILTHTWSGNPYCGVEQVRRAAERYPNVRLILGHSIHGAWDEAAEIAAEFPNVYLELCAVLDERAGILEKFVSVAGSEKVLFGTDFPWFSHHYYIGGVLAAEITDEDRRNIFCRNAERLLGIRG